ncbi:MAG: hypothetical protein SV760_04765 [Halobacteria archaeon]|nr:hypothetical protein [Halobacteria archaeon]
MIPHWLLSSEISNRNLAMVILLSVILVPLGVYTAVYPGKLQNSEERLLRAVLPDTVMDAFVRLMGLLFAVGWSYILVMSLLKKFA